MKRATSATPRAGHWFSLSRQRGVALITAVLLVAMATVLATRIGSRGAIDQRRASALMLREQAYQIALGAEAWAGEILREDAQKGQEDTLVETWAMPLPALPVDGGEHFGVDQEFLHGWDVISWDLWYVLVDVCQNLADGLLR